MKRKVKKFGRGGDVLTGLGAGLIGYHLYDKYMGGDKDKDKDKDKELEAVGGPGRSPRTIKQQTGREAEPKAESREDYLEKRGAKPIKETGTFTGPDTAEPDLEYKDKVVKPKPAVKKAAPAAQPKNAEPAAQPKKASPAKKVDAQTETEGFAPKDKSGYSLPSKNVTSMIEGKGSSTEPKTSGGARNRAGMLVNPNFIAPKKASEEEVSEARASLAKRRAEQSRSFQESPLMKAISGGGSRADFYRKKREQEDAERGMKKGGVVKSSASRRADGIAQRGKTRGRIC